MNGEKNNMNEQEEKFKVTYLSGSYIVKADPGTSLDIIWLSQKSWFLAGTEVTISDSKGNCKTFCN